MPVSYDTGKLTELFEDHDDGKLALPNFQREFVWSLDDQKQLLASVLAGFPVGSLLVLKGTGTDFAARPLGKMKSTTPDADCAYLLDGQQRLTCFYHFFSDPFGHPSRDWQQTVRDTYFVVRNRWFVRVVPTAEEADPFGFEWLRFPGPVSEPDDVKDFVEPQRINITKPGHFANPQWLAERVEGFEQEHGLAKLQATSRARLELARECAGRGLVPLWEVFSGPHVGASSLHSQVLQLISQKRADELEMLVGDPSPEFIESATAVNPSLFEGQASIDDLTAAIPAMRQSWVENLRRHLEGLVSTSVPVVTLPKDEVDRSIPIFEVMNRGGTPLTTFDLVVAKRARVPIEGGPDPGLTQHLVEHARSLKIRVTDAVWGDNVANRLETWRGSNYNFMLDKGSLATVYKNAFLNLLSLKVHSDESSVEELQVDHIRRKAILAVSPEAIDSNWTEVAEAIGRAWCFLNVRCGIRGASDLRNKLVLLPIAFVLLDQSNVENRRVLDRLEYWYWASVLTSTYTERQNDNCVGDLKRLSDWLANESENPFEQRASLAFKSSDYSDKATLLRETEDAAVATDIGQYLPQYVLSRNPKDFLTGIRLGAWDTGTDLELHHIVPLWSATSIGESSAALRSSDAPSVLASPLNMTFISKTSNRSIGARPITQYMQELDDAEAASHCWPIGGAELTKKQDESDDEFYRRLLLLRYENLNQVIADEMDRLLTV